MLTRNRFLTFKLICVFLIVFLGIAQTTSVLSASSVGWPMQGHDMSRTGRGTTTGPLNAHVKWAYDFMDPIWGKVTLQDNASPIVSSDGTIYQITRIAGIYAIKPDGTLKWHMSGADGFTYRGDDAPALSPDYQVLYLTASSSNGYAIVALNAQTGSKLWAYTLGGFGTDVSYSSLAVDGNGVIYVGSRLPASLIAINPNGTVKWSYTPANPDLIGIESPPAVDSNGNVYAVINTIGLVAIDSSGHFKWKSNDIIEKYGWPTPTIGPDGTIYLFQAVYTSQSFYAINPNGTLKWVRTDIGSANFLKGAALSSDGLTVYTAADGKVYALNATTGATRWVNAIADVSEEFGGSIALSTNNILYIAGNSSAGGNDYIYAVSALNGALVWKYQLNSTALYWSPQSPALGPNGILYMVTSGEPPASGNIAARLYAFGPTVSCTAITISPASLPNATPGTSYNQTISASGGLAPYSFLLTDGNLPNGLSLSKAGVISGVPTSNGLYTFTVSVVDTNGCIGEKSYQIQVKSLVTISGNAGAPGATLSYTDGTTKTVVSQANGTYSLQVSYGWSGTITPSHPCYTFNPPNHSYTNVTVNTLGQNFAATLNPASGCAIVNVTVGGIARGQYGIPSHASLRQNYSNLDSGPAKIFSTNALSILSSERFIYSYQNSKSYAEMMGYPGDELATSYWFTWYNNLSYSTQLRVSNMGSKSAEVKVYAGSSTTPIDTFTLVAGEGKRTSYAVDNGPLHVASTDGVTPILASERFIQTFMSSASYAEMMGYPGDQLATEYWFPWYNNLSYSTQLRVSNLGNGATQIKVYAASSTTPIDTFTLAAGEGARKSYTGLDNGPLHVVSTDGVTPILASERFIYTYGNSASYAEMMGYPGDQLTSEYCFPWYNNVIDSGVALSSQLRVSNMGTTSVTVKVTLAGSQIDNFTLAGGEGKRTLYPGANNGPLCVTRTSGSASILASERFISTYLNSASYSEKMGYPTDQLASTYWFPWYNNLSYSTEFRIAKP